MTGSMYLKQLSPELCLLVGACLAFLIGASKRAAVRSVVAPFALLVLLAAMGATAFCAIGGSGENPAGLSFTQISDYVRWITLIVGVVILFANWEVPVQEERGDFFGMILCSMAGVMLTASANDLVVLFFAIELVSVPTYVLIALSRADARASESAVKYFFLGALAAAVLVYGFSFLYGASGTTVLQSSTGASIANEITGGESMSLYTIIGLVLVFAGLSFKVAAVPFHAYAPDVYEGAASPVTGLLGFLPKLAGFVAMVKIMTVCHWNLPDVLMWMLWIVAALTMTVGNVLALLQNNVKRILAYSSISHTGYMLIGILVGPVMGEGPMRNGVAALLFYVFIYGLMNLGAFSVLAYMNIRGKSVETLEDLAGMSQRAPLAALAMLVCTFSLMGFPPTAGFMGKVYLLSSAFSVGPAHVFHGPLIVLAVIAVINSAIGAAYYLRIASACFLREPSDELRAVGGDTLRATLAVCSFAMIALFIRPGALVNNAKVAAKELEPGQGAAVATVAPDASQPLDRRSSQ